MRLVRREVLFGIASAGLLPREAHALLADAITPEAFGAKGDGRTNDTHAFSALSDHVSARGGGTVVLSPTTYIVGRHDDRANAAVHMPGAFAFPPARILQFVNCRGPVIVHGNGAILKAARGLKFGSFDPQTGRPFKPKMPFTKREYRASPYFAMIEARGCMGLVQISDVELDGNLGELEVGGMWGDANWQIPGSGIRLTDNSGPERLSRIFIHHQPLDGLTVTGASQRASYSILSGLTCDYNARQGCSITGGRNYVFERCQFRRTGKGGLRSKPAAGVDIEAERPHIIRNLQFSECIFSDNASAGIVADSGDSFGASFEKCTFIGTTSWSAWPKKPGMRFDNCLFVGAVVNAFGDPDPARAAKFYDCAFRDDPALSPTKEVYGGTNRTRPIAVLAGSPNALFKRCNFALTHDCALPWSTKAVIFSDCRMSQRSSAQSHPRGTYLGTNTISGNANLAGSIIRGNVILNGRRLPPS